MPMSDTSLVADLCDSEEDLLFFVEKWAFGIFPPSKVYALYLAKKAWAMRCRTREEAIVYMDKLWDKMTKVRALSRVERDDIAGHHAAALDNYYTRK